MQIENIKIDLLLLAVDCNESPGTGCSIKNSTASNDLQEQVQGQQHQAMLDPHPLLISFCKPLDVWELNRVLQLPT